MIKLNDKKVLGAMYGVAIGDALGGPLEFMDADEINKKHGEVREMIGGGWLNLKKGDITDDTDMTLAVAEGIMEYPADPVFSVGVNMIKWYDLKPIDVGINCKYVISKVSKIVNPKQEDWFKASEQYHIYSNGQSAGNGSLMRMVYPAIFYKQEKSVDIAINLGKMTHWHDHSTLAITCYTKAIAEFVRTSVETEISYLKERLEFHMQDIRALQPDDLQPTGYVIDSLLCALNCIRDTQNFEDAVVKAVNLGGDADTIGAITGSLAGAIYGYSEIPQRWLECLNDRANSRIERIANYAIGINQKEIRTLYRPQKPRKTKITKSREIVERMFRLYVVLINCEIARYEEIFMKVYYSSYKLFQRDFKMLNDIGLIKMYFCRKSKGYIHTDGYDSIVDESNYRWTFEFENYERIENPPKNIEQLYRLADLFHYDLYDDTFSVSVCEFDDSDNGFVKEYVYCSTKHVGCNKDYTFYLKGKFHIYIEPPSETAYYRDFPETTKENYYDDMETLIRLGDDFRNDTTLTTIASIRDDLLASPTPFIMDFTKTELFWENGEPIDLKKDSEFYFYNFCNSSLFGAPCGLPRDTIPKEKWPKVKGYNWDEN